MQKIYQGESATISFSKTPEQTEAKLILRKGAIVLEFDAVDDGAQWIIELTPDNTTQLPDGTVRAFSRIVEAGKTNICEIDSIVILPDPTQAVDQRSQWEIDLEVTDDALRKIAQKQFVASYSVQTTVGKRDLSRMTLEEIRAYRRFVIKQINIERTAQGKKPLGNDRWRPIRTTIGNQSRVRRRRY